MSIRAVPEPKLAMTAGAYTVSSRAPNWVRRAGVATTTSEPSGCGAVPSISSRPAGTPLACRAAHIAGSHATIALGATCRATHPAGGSRAAVAAFIEAAFIEAAFIEAAFIEAAAGEAGLAWRDNAAGDAAPRPMKAPAAAAATTTASTPASASRRRPEVAGLRTGCRSSHSRTVVAITAATMARAAAQRLPPGYRAPPCRPETPPPGRIRP